VKNASAARPSLEARELSYSLVGATLDGQGWQNAAARQIRTHEQSVRIGNGDAHWEFASESILKWGIKRRSGFTVEPGRGISGLLSDVSVGERFWLIAHIGPLRVREPVEVVGVIDDEDRKGFAYGTLQGHPVSGEELFLVERRVDGSVWLTLRSMTSPSSGMWRFAYPAILVAQRVYRRRYAKALAERDSFHVPLGSE